MYNLVRKIKTVTLEDGTVKHYTNYFLVTENGNYIAIKPSFENDYKLLYVLATEVKEDN